MQCFCAIFVTLLEAIFAALELTMKIQVETSGNFIVSDLGAILSQQYRSGFDHGLNFM